MSGENWNNWDIHNIGKQFNGWTTNNNTKTLNNNQWILVEDKKEYNKEYLSPEDYEEMFRTKTINDNFEQYLKIQKTIQENIDRCQQLTYRSPRLDYTDIDEDMQKMIKRFNEIQEEKAKIKKEQDTKKDIEEVMSEEALEKALGSIPKKE